MLGIRVREVYVLERLLDVSRTRVFAQAFKESASRKYEALKKAAQDPGDTAKGIPSGVGRFFKRTWGKAKREIEKGKEKRAEGEAETAAQEEAIARGEASPPPPATTGQKVGKAGDVAGDVGKALLGYEKTRRSWAQRFEADPYTTNPAVRERLDDVAWAATAGGFTLGQALPPLPALVGEVETASHLVWDASPQDIEAGNWKKLEGLGVSTPAIAALFLNRNVAPGIALSFVDALEVLAPRAGAESAVGWMTGAESEEDARFAARSARILALAHAQSPLRRIKVAGGILAGIAEPGDLVVALPADLVSWTEDVDAALGSPELAAETRTLWIAGTATARARAALGAAGWTIRERALSASVPD